MLGPSKAAHSILVTSRTYSNEFMNRSSQEGFSTGFQHVYLGFVPLSEFSSRWNLKSNTRYGRLKWVEITSVGNSNFNFTHAVDTNPKAQKMTVVWSYDFIETRTRRLQQIPGKYQKNTSGSYSSLKN